MLISKPSQRSPERILRVVLSVLGGEVSVVEIARRAGVAEQTVHNWKNAFLESGRAGLAGPAGPQRRQLSRELELEAEHEGLKATLGDAHVQLRAWQ